MLNDIIKDPRRSLHQLTAMFSVGKVEIFTWDDSGLLRVAHRSTSSEGRLAKGGKLVKDDFDVSLVDSLVRGPRHFVKHLLQIFPVEPHQGALAIAQLTVDGNV